MRLSLMTSLLFLTTALSRGQSANSIYPLTEEKKVKRKNKMPQKWRLPHGLHRN